MHSGHPLAMKDSLDCLHFADQELLPGDPMWSSHGHDFIPKARHGPDRRSSASPRWPVAVRIDDGPEFARRAFARCASEV